MIDLQLIQKELMEKKWKNIKEHPDFESIVKFEIIDEKKSWYLADWFLCIKEVENLDDATANQIVQTLNSIENQKRSWWQAKIFFFFILADQVNPATASRIASNEFDIRNFNIKGQVSGRIFVIDLANSLVYGTLPTTPLDARLKLSHMKDSLEKVLNKPLHYVPANNPKKTLSFLGKLILTAVLFFILGFVAALIFLRFS